MWQRDRPSIGTESIILQLQWRIDHDETTPLQTSMKGIFHDLQLSKGTLSTLSFDLFRDWTIKASKMHTELDFTIKDERVLVRDLQKSIVNGLIALEEKPSDELSFKGRGYKNGFLRGFVFSNLECRMTTLIGGLPK